MREGKLKIFFGYCAGVGKTYAMLQEAHQQSVLGKDVVIGYIEPHDRKETMDLVYGLEQIPPKEIIYKNHVFHEFDIDAALKRHPQIILIDELAHTNAPTSRHKKRYCDIQEVLRAGIDVYTTVNVQHIESLHDVVESITHIKVNERIPDPIFDDASDIKLVDIEIEELLQRLKEGKIYSKQQAKTAMQHFFIKDNLIALKEIALRRCADRINSYSPDQNKPFLKEHILVCIGSSPTNEKVIRTAARMAQVFHGEFTALFVETSNTKYMNEKAKKQLQSNITLARHLKADIVSTYGDDIALQISQYAKASNVSKLVLGRSYQKPMIFKKRTIVDTLTSLSPNLEIFIIPDHRSSGNYNQKTITNTHKLSIKELSIALISTLLTTMIAYAFYQMHTSITTIILLYIMMTCILSMYVYSTSIHFIITLLNTLIIDYFFMEPRFSLAYASSEYPMILLVMMLVSFVISQNQNKLRQENKLASIRAHSMDILLQTSQHLQLTTNYEQIQKEACEQLYKLLHRPILFYPVYQQELLEPIIYPGNEYQKEWERYISSKEQTIAKWAFINNKNAGASTSTIPSAACLYMTIRKKDTVYAVVGIPLEEELTTYEKSLIVSLLNEIALAFSSQHNEETTPI